MSAVVNERRIARANRPMEKIIVVVMVPPYGLTSLNAVAKPWLQSERNALSLSTLSVKGLNSGISCIADL